jgi:uncharacterized protein (DUF1800 family)
VVRRDARAWAGVVAGLVLSVLAGCATLPAAPPADSAADARWLDRVTYGVDAATLARVRREGREPWLAAQLAGRAGPLPAAVAREIDALPVEQAAPETLLDEVRTEQRRLDTLPEGDERQAARKALYERGSELAYQAARRELLRALYSPNQLEEQLVWFWSNHFSVHQDKAHVRWLVGDYVEHAIRPHALGRFRDLVLATLRHPAMLEYLDNAKNAAGHPNENYARELLELHTLGVDGGYTQADVEALARVLTGVGLAAESPPKLAPARRALYVKDGAFEFHPGRHDFGDKTLLGVRIQGRGWPEVEQAVDVIVARPACARFVASRLATYFVADRPPPALVERMAAAFRASGGDIAATLGVALRSPELAASLGTKFRDPWTYTIASLRLAYEGQSVASLRPVLGWLRSLGEAPWTHPTPDGFPLTEAGWASSGQLARRFEIARAIGGGGQALFAPEDGTPATASGFPRLASRLYYDAIEPRLSEKTRAVLARASSPQEWNTLLLSAPEMNFR